VAVGDIAGQTSKTITITVKILPEAAGTTIHNVAVAKGDGEDPKPSDPTTDTVNPEHHLTKAVIPTTRSDKTYHVGDTLTYTIVASNDSDPAEVWHNVVITDDLVDTVELLSVSGGTNTGTGNHVVVPVGDLAGGQSKTITIKVKLLPASANTTVINTAVATSDDDTPKEPDPNPTPVNPEVLIRYHLMTPTGTVIATDIYDIFAAGQTIDPTLYLNMHKPFGYGDGIPVATPWVVAAADITPAAYSTMGGPQVFDIYYPNTPPVINVTREVIYVRYPVVLELPDLLRIAGVSITDAEEGTIPLSKLVVDGYDGIKWSVINYGDGAYVVTLNATDTPGLEAAPRQIAIFVEKQSTKVTPIEPGDPKHPDLPYLPPGMKWGIDEDGNEIIYIPYTTPIAIPKTGDVVTVTVPLIVLAGALVLLLLLLARRKEAGEMAG